MNGDYSEMEAYNNMMQRQVKPGPEFNTTTTYYRVSPLHVLFYLESCLPDVPCTSY